ncbi:MAG: glycerophosphodiester phosphodiesterase [Proteobacteria bacterium]|nr:glycerophosphodiester phosphodiesterase [Pseudomonadota bacterium]
MKTIAQQSQRMIIAHRGYRARYPENTLVAFKAAKDLGVRMIELDVCLTRDRNIVAIHDETLDRTTNGSGPVRDHTLEELKKLDAGRWFSPFFTGEKIPTLKDVFSLCNHKLSVNIEIKHEAFESHDPDDSIEKQVVQTVLERSRSEAVIISSFEPRIIERLAKMQIKNLRLAFLTEKRFLDDAILEFMIKNKVFSWNPDYPALTPDQIKAAQAQGIKVMTYTVNKASTGKRCFDMGVDGIFTDEPLLF